MNQATFLPDNGEGGESSGDEVPSSRITRTESGEMRTRVDSFEQTAARVARVCVDGAVIQVRSVLSHR
eukprot:3721352-Prymnesium_polylepis.1